MGTPVTRRNAVSAAVADPEKAVVEKQVIETTHFARPITEDEKNVQANKNETDNQSNPANNQTSANYRQIKTQVAENRLVNLFDDLRQEEETEHQVFFATIVRKPDFVTDTFKKPCLSNQFLAPMQIHSGMYLQFIPLLIKANGNSGGRFDIAISSADGEPYDDIGINGFIVADPVEEEKTEVKTGNDMLEFMKWQAEENRRDRETMLLAAKPKEDEFMSLVREKMRNDFLNPPQNQKKEFDMQEVMVDMMKTQTVMAAMGEGFAAMFNRNNGGEKDEGLLKFLLGNEMFVEKAQQTIEHLSNVGAAVVSRIVTPTAPPITPADLYEEEGADEPYPPISAGNPTINIPTEEQINMERQEVIKTVLAELESKNPLDETNEVLIKLKEDHADIYQTLLQTCKQIPFEMVSVTLKTGFPNEFAPFYNADGKTLNERGVYAMERLEAFYEMMKAREA